MYLQYMQIVLLLRYFVASIVSPFAPVLLSHLSRLEKQSSNGQKIIIIFDDVVVVLLLLLWQQFMLLTNNSVLLLPWC